MNQRKETIRRIQVGLIGLSAILAMLVVGGAIVSRLRNDPAKSTVSTLAKPVDKTSAPLVKLGIAPADIERKQATPTNSATGR